MKEVIAATTAAANYEIGIPADQYVTVVADGLAGAETVTVQVRIGASPVTVQESGSNIECTATTNLIQIAGPATYNLAKSTTASAVAVYLGE